MQAATHPRPAVSAMAAKCSGALSDAALELLLNNNDGSDLEDIEDDVEEFQSSVESSGKVL